VLLAVLSSMLGASHNFGISDVFGAHKAASSGLAGAPDGDAEESDEEEDEEEGVQGHKEDEESLWGSDASCGSGL
jgi:hypothetical protein